MKPYCEDRFGRTPDLHYLLAMSSADHIYQSIARLSGTYPVLTRFSVS